ncbi:Hsp70 family protein [Aetokthonos hydrillicola Thurmond2011]|jgi:molecular chaperone DnaK|uniref:Hsp70 family protein n=1 Tax=Aetokthonos hydrillicola Thurmond2011 TaxID=2712845 RepID=A0AAP5M2R9_9CYAN|nr:Hsp70 family protein [Aetokthonos hydrillicola]MBO3460159.1 Hsp70 family protein [Aetokthonos hydrillicola CCALA 1050]MBW4590487.1 Hsp70 family protein [Aetokthonos hydrillicola CCALA 1050]MDR9893016.1 Hsp70 family protein [Aetokthonos hydrillicola Thurmond2011]
MQSYKIGLDFGTTNSIISYLEDGKLEAFQYGGASGKKYIPSFISYDDNFIEIGDAARNNAAHQPNIKSYGNFKMRLPIPESELVNSFQDGRTPMSVTKDYLNELLLSKENESSSFSNQQGKIAGLVVSVPEIWQRDICNLGRERLQRLITEDLELGDKLIQLVSEPVAAAAYYAWEVQRQAQQNKSEKFTGNLLVCDMGGGTFDVSLCRIFGNNKVEVLYFDGQGDKGLESAGVAFDCRCVQIAYMKKNKNNHRLDKDKLDFSRLVKEFESVKIDSHARSTNKLKNYLKDPEAMSEQNLYTFSGGYNVTFKEVSEAFAPVAEGIQRVMQRVKDWLQDNDQKFERLFFVGGFCQFLLVQKAIAEALGIEDNDPRFDRSFNTINSTFAISYGACLIANGLIDPTERYIHTLGIVVDRINAQAEKEQLFIPIINGGVCLDDLASPHFADIPPLVTFQSDAPLTITIWIDPRSKGRKFKEVLPDMVKLPSYSPSNRWRVGMRVNRSQVAYLVIEEVHGNPKVEYELGNIIAKMFPGFFLFED